jgi:hypothetical protein
VTTASDTFSAWAVGFADGSEPFVGGATVGSANSLTITVVLATLLVLAVVGQGWRVHAWKLEAVRTAPDRLLHPPVPSPGFQLACLAAGAAILILILYQFAIGFEVSTGRARLQAAVCALAGFASAWVLFLSCGRRWQASVSDVALGLIGASLICLSGVLQPPLPDPLADRYPRLFNGAVFALAFAVAFYHWLAVVWTQQLDGGVAWTTAGRLIEPARRMGQYAGALGLGVGVLMAAWPRMRVAADLDDTLGRFACGVGGYLALVLALLYANRTRRHAALVGLCVLVTAAMLGFIYLRAEPFASVRH